MMTVSRGDEPTITELRNRVNEGLKAPLEFLRAVKVLPHVLCAEAADGVRQQGAAAAPEAARQKTGKRRGDSSRIGAGPGATLYLALPLHGPVTEGSAAAMAAAAGSQQPAPAPATRRGCRAALPPAAATSAPAAAPALNGLPGASGSAVLTLPLEEGLALIVPVMRAAVPGGFSSKTAGSILQGMRDLLPHHRRQFAEALEQTLGDPLAHSAASAAAAEAPGAKRARRGGAGERAGTRSAAAAAAATAVATGASEADATKSSDGAADGPHTAPAVASRAGPLCASGEDDGTPPDGPGVGDDAGRAGGWPGAENDYERQRQQQIARNRARMMALQLPALAAGMAAAAEGSKPHKPSQRGVGNGKRARASAEPPQPRVSLRLRGVKADEALAAGVAHETADGRVVLVTGGGAPAAPKPRHPQGDLPFRSENGSAESDAAFLSKLQGASLPLPSPMARGDAGAAGDDGASRKPLRAAPAAAAAAAAAAAPGSKALCGIALKQEDVAKVTKDGVTHLCFYPGLAGGAGGSSSGSGSGSSYGVLMAAGDKSGRISLWHVDEEAGGPAAEHDGVLMFAPHNEYVSGLQWLGPDAAVGPSRLVSVAYDGGMRALDLGGAGTWLRLPAPGDPAEQEFSALALAADGRTAYVGTPEGELFVVDLRASASNAAAQPLHLSDRKINTLSLEPCCQTLLASSSSDGMVAIWDVRKLGAASAEAAAGRPSKAAAGKAKPLSVLRHSKSCHSAYWAHDGSQRIVSTSYDDTIRIWAPSKASASPGGEGSHHAEALAIKHNNQTGRWITPFRAVWSAACDAVVVGNMKRGVDVISAATGAPVHSLSSNLQTAIPSRIACHPSVPLLVAATSSGRCHVWR